jgi:hypothetical protein
VSAPIGRVRAGTAADPMWTVTVGGRSVTGSPTSLTSSSSVRANIPGLTSASPRRTRSRSTPRRLTATRATASTARAGEPRDSSPRTRTPRRAVARDGLQFVVDSHSAGTQRAGDDGAAATDREAPVDPQPHRRTRVGRR